MAETKNIYIPRTIAAENTDSLIKTGVAEIELRNGDIVEVGAKTNGVYALTAVTDAQAAGVTYGIVYNADVATEGNYRGLSDDPRDVVFAAGTIVNFYYPQKGDEVAVTVVAGTATGAKYLVPTDGKVGYTYASTVSTESLVYAITGTKFVSVGNVRIPTVEAVCTVA
jgi:anaerobic selenocysteine-containing dehydrogenase